MNRLLGGELMIAPDCAYEPALMDRGASEIGVILKLQQQADLRNPARNVAQHGLTIAHVNADANVRPRN